MAKKMGLAVLMVIMQAYPLLASDKEVVTKDVIFVLTSISAIMQSNSYFQTYGGMDDPGKKRLDAFINRMVADGDMKFLDPGTHLTIIQKRNDGFTSVRGPTGAIWYVRTEHLLDAAK